MKLATRIFERSDWYVTSEFGPRINPVTGKKSFHYGTDYGTHVQPWKQYALEDGIVVAVRTGKKDKDGSGYGNYVKIKYPRLGIRVLHAHLKKVNVKKNQNVTHETCIGTTGMTGTATGVHLHLGLQTTTSDTWLNPHEYDYQEPKPEPEEIKLGDTVIVNGVGTASSTGEGARTRKFVNQEMKVIMISGNTSRPNRYALNQYNKGKINDASAVTGWFSEKDIKKK